MYPYPRDAQRKAVEEGHSEFVITNTIEANSSPNPYNIRRLYDEVHVIQGTGYQSNVFYHLFQLKPYTSFDDGFQSMLISIESNANNSSGSLAAMYDNDSSTQWDTGRDPQTGDYLIFEFDENVTYNTIYMDLGRYSYGYPINLLISVSIDGNEWQEAPLIFMDNFVNIQFEVNYYRYIKLTINDSPPNWLGITEIYFGYTKGDSK